jgi:tetratricopeptide (TPR) repeat protein
MSTRTFFFVFALAGTLFGAPPTDPATDWQKLMLSGVSAASSRNYAKAEELLTKAIAEAAQFPPGDPRPGTALNTLGLVYKEQKKYGDADKAFEKALAILEKTDGPDSLNVGNTKYNIASVLLADGHYDAALPYIQQSRTVYEKILGANSLKAASALCLLGEADRNLKKFTDAEVSLKQCADMREASGGVADPEFADALYNLALVYEHQGKFREADPRMKMAEKIRELAFGVTSPEFAEVLEAHIGLLRLMNRDAEAAKDEALLFAIRRATKAK